MPRPICMSEAEDTDSGANLNLTLIFKDRAVDFEIKVG